MNEKSGHSRREFIEGALAAGAAFVFAGVVQGNEKSYSLGDFGIPLTTQTITGPNDNCYWVGFSPINDRVAFVSGISDRRSLYVSRLGQPESFDLLWEPTSDSSVIKTLAWSPNGQEIAFLVQTVNDQTSPKSAKNSIYLVNVVSRAIREPIIIGENINRLLGQNENATYKNDLSWWGNSYVCVPANDGGVLKFDKFTGQSDILISPQDGTFISSIALTRSGELRFVKAKGIETNKDVEFYVGGLRQDSTICDYGNLNQQFGQIFSVRLSQDGEYVFVQKHGAPPKSLQAFLPITHLIYKIETHSIIGQIPAVVDTQKDMYMYMPLAVKNDNELIFIEAFSPELDGSNSYRNPIMRIVQMSISPEKQYRTGED